MRNKNKGVYSSIIRLVKQLRICALQLIIPIMVILLPQTGNAISERGAIALGYFNADRDTAVRLDSETLGKGTEVDFENDLGMDRTTAAVRIAGYYKFSPKSRIDISYFDLSRRSSAVIEEDIQFGDEVFEVNIKIDSTLYSRVLKLAYTWSFLLRDSDYLGFSLGLYTAQTKVSLRATDIGKKESESLNAPLPMLGLHGQYEFAPRWTVQGSAELFGLKIDNVGGNWSDLIASVEYNAYKQIRIGGGYNILNVNADYTKNDLKATYNTKYQGPMLYVKVVFGKVE